MQEGFAAYDELIIEPYLDAVELEIGVLGNSKDEDLILSPIVEIFKNENVSLYAYEDKYFGANRSQITIPARLSEAEKDLLYSYAKKAYKAIGGVIYLVSISLCKRRLAISLSTKLIPCPVSRQKVCMQKLFWLGEWNLIPLLKKLLI